MADKLHQALNSLVIEHQHRVLKVTASVGIAAAIPERGEEYPVLIQRADEALYRAKAKGRNQYQVADSVA